MRSINLRVHPLTRRVLLSEYGAEPIRVGQRDILYSALTSGQPFDRNDLSHADRLLSATIALEISDALAEHLSRKWRAVGLHLFRWHKDCMFRYCAAMVRRNGSAKGAIREWLDIYQVGEDQYGADTAYKKWQRSGWFLKEKNPDFLAKLLESRGSKRGGKSGIYAKSKLPLKTITLTKNEIDVELETNRCMTAILLRVKRPPKQMPQQIRAYLYKVLFDYTDVQIAKIMDRPRETVRDMRYSMERRAAQNAFFRKILEEVLAYAKIPA